MSEEVIGTSPPRHLMMVIRSNGEQKGVVIKSIVIVVIQIRSIFRAAWGTNAIMPDVLESFLNIS